MQVIEREKAHTQMNNIREFEKCAISPSYFATKYCQTLNVETNAIEQFPAYDYLVNFLEENAVPHNEHIEKSRQMMISWAFMVLFLWDLTFKGNIADFITSRKETLVDDGGSLSTPNSLLGRIRFMWDRLPAFLKMPLEFTFLKITNPITNSFIIGESSNPNAGRSGTWHRALMDEAALIPKSEVVFSSIFQACKKGTYMNSTPYGRGGCFARIRFEKDSTFYKRSLHWRRHPDRNEKWYNIQCVDMTPDQIARELDISYEKSVAGQIYHMFDFGKQVGDYPYIPELPQYNGWDFGTGAPTVVLWIQEIPVAGQPFPEIHIFHELEKSEKTPPFFAEYIRNVPYKKRDEYGNEHLREAIHYGDPAGKQRQVNMKSWISWLKELGIHVQTKHGVKIVDSIMAGQRIMPYVRVDKSCVRFLECITSYKHPTDDQGRVIGDGYEENWATHTMKAFEYYAVNRFPLNKSVIGVW
ncbi:MAG TPA: hypothetical protein ENN61_03020 [Bacteroidaceae bacterium]|nr:hypothetical protein [Bacteroidaceae bacterium]